MPEEKKQPIRLTQQRAEALLAVFETGARAVEEDLRKRVGFAALATVEEAQALKTQDLRLAAAKDAAAIIRHRYLHGEEPTTPHETLF